MIPYEIMLSESQERMLLVAKKRGREHAKSKRCSRKWDLHAVRRRHVTDTGPPPASTMAGTLVADVPARALTDEGFPVYHRPDDSKCRLGRPSVQEFNLASISAAQAERRRTAVQAPAGLAGRSPSKRWAYRQFDHSGRHQHHCAAGLGLRPVSCASKENAQGPGDVGGRQRPLLLPRSVPPGRCWLWPRRPATSPCAGAEPIGATNNLNFGNPERPEIMWQFAEAVRGIGRSVPRRWVRRSPAATSASTTRPTAGPSTRRRCWAWSGCSRTRRRP